MGRTVSMGTMYANLPFPPFVSTTTKKKFPCGRMMSGLHFEEMKSLDVTLLVVPAHQKFTCLSCRREIKSGEVAGHSDRYFCGYHCADCIHLPEGVEVWQLTYTQRKSRRHPDGTVVETIVHFPAKVEEFQRELTAALVRPVNARKVADAVGVRM